MRIPDTNLLVYTVHTASPHHAPAVAWLRRAFADRQAVGFAPVAIVGFIRVVTNHRIAGHVKPSLALDHVDNWLDQPNATVLSPGARHWSTLRVILDETGAAGNLVNDAHLAALAIDHGATLASFDGDFHRFPGLKFEYLNAPGCQ